MTEYIIRLFIEDGTTYDLKCKNLSDYAYKCALLDEKFPKLNWGEIRK